MNFRHGLALAIAGAAMVVDLAAAALEPGDKAVPLPRRGWVRGEEVSIPSAAERIENNKSFHPESHLVLLFWGAWASGSGSAMATVAAMQEKYPGLRAAAVTRDPAEQINKFMADKPAFPFSILQDDATDRVFNAYLGSDTILPRVFVIDADKNVLWNGEVTDLPDFMARLADGGFSLSREKKLTPGRQRLLLALQTGDTDAVLRHSLNLLDIDTRCGLALRSLLFVYETRNQQAEAIRQIDKLIERDADWFRLYMLKLELQVRSGATAEEILITVKTASVRFKRNADALNQLSWFMLDRLPFRLQPPELLLEVGGNAWQSLPADATAGLRFSCAHAYARTLLLLGRPAEGRAWLNYGLGLLPEKSPLRIDVQSTEKIYAEVMALQAPTRQVLTPPVKK